MEVRGSLYRRRDCTGVVSVGEGVLGAVLRGIVDLHVGVNAKSEVGHADEQQDEQRRENGKLDSRNSIFVAKAALERFGTPAGHLVNPPVFYSSSLVLLEM